MNGCNISLTAADILSILHGSLNPNDFGAVAAQNGTASHLVIRDGLTLDSAALNDLATQLSTRLNDIHLQSVGIEGEQVMLILSNGTKIPLDRSLLGNFLSGANTGLATDAELQQAINTIQNANANNVTDAELDRAIDLINQRLNNLPLSRYLIKHEVNGTTLVSTMSDGSTVSVDLGAILQAATGSTAGLVKLGNRLLANDGSQLGYLVQG